MIIDYESLTKEIKDTTTPYFMYIIPHYQNPTGRSMSEYEKIKLMEVLDLHKNLTVLSDEVYYRLGFVPIRGKPLCNYHKQIVSLGSLSKSFSPALRMGWINADKYYIDKMVLSGQLDSSGNVNPIGCLIVHNLILTQKLESNEKMWRDFLHKNYLLLNDALNKYLLKYIDNISKIDGGYFVWVKLKDNIDTEKLSENMEKFGVKFHYGNKFSKHKSFRNHIRLSFSWNTGTDYDLGIQRLANLIDDYIENQQTKILVHVMGHRGKLGSLIVEELQKKQNTDSVKYYGSIERDINLNSLNPTKSIIIDVSHPKGTEALLTKLLQTKSTCPVLVGTTGDLPIDLIKEYGKNAPIAICSNFSQGINEFKKIIININKSEWNATLSETHHVHKKDSPSGTAKSLVKLYGEEHIPLSAVQSVREGEVIGEHTLFLENEYETIIITHKAKDRKLFALGSIKWIEWLNEQKNGVYYEMC